MRARLAVALAAVASFGAFAGCASFAGAPSVCESDSRLDLAFDGWLPRDEVVRTFEDAGWTLAPGEASVEGVREVDEVLALSLYVRWTEANETFVMVLAHAEGREPDARPANVTRVARDEIAAILALGGEPAMRMGGAEGPLVCRHGD